MANSLSRENIKNRMLKRVAALWEVRSADNLDPLVRLLIESLAGEVFRLTGHYEDSQKRIMDKVAHVLTPADMTSAKPSHAILHARALEGVCQLERTSVFDYKKPQYVRRFDLNTLPFSPVGNPRIVDGAVDYMVSGGKLYGVDPAAGKEHIANAIARNPVLGNTVWIGLSLGEGVRTLKDISLYFDFSYIEGREEYYLLLPYIEWSVGGTQLTAQSGLPGSCIGEGILDRYSLRDLTEQSVMSRYEHRFVTLTSDIPVKELQKDGLPAELEGLFGTEVNSSLMEPRIWLKGALPAHFSGDAAQAMVVHTNCFPVANKYLKRYSRTLTATSAIMPLPKDDAEYFLGVEAVSDGHGREYTELLPGESTTNGTYSLRKGGCERFDAVDAREYLIRLMDLLRDESMAFSNMDKDTIGSSAADLLRQIDRLEYKATGEGDLLERLSYLIFETLPDEACDMSASYWVSNGRVTEQIKAGERLEYSGSRDVDKTSVVLLTQPGGGSEAPSQASRIDMFRFALASRGAVYSREDIRSFVLSRYGELVKDVTVLRGYAKSIIPREGIVRTLDVKIYGSDGLSAEQRAGLAEQIAFGLRKASPESFNYRIFID